MVQDDKKALGEFRGLLAPQRRVQIFRSSFIVALARGG
jgi:hypothetical protein